jgi:monoamine oxidase
MTEKKSGSGEAPQSEIPRSADVVIVGAGMAGLYCAYRLLAQDANRSVVLFDRLDRVGGRLDTDLVKIKGEDGQVVGVKDEEGGMRFNQSMQQLFALLDDLGLSGQVVPFGMGDDNNYYHVRGRSFTVAESEQNNNAIWSQLYALLPNERNKSPVDIITAVYHDILAQNGKQAPANPTPGFWQEFRLDYKYNGTPLNEWGLWALMRTFGLSQECISMLADTVGFAAPFFSLVSAGEAYQILEDFPAQPEYSTLADGYSTLPQTLTEKIESKNGSIFLSSLVTKINSEDGRFTVDVQRGGRNHSVSCSKVILALPALALNNLYATSPALNEAKNPKARELYDNLQSVVSMRLSKVNLYYDQAWWRDGIEGGRPAIKDGGSFTSLPLGAVYVFDPLKGESANGPAALTIYSDFNNTHFWEELQAIGPKFTSPLQEEHDHDRPQVMFPASEAIVGEATSLLKILFQMLSIPRPVLTSYRMWSGEHQFGYAYHQWARFADDRKVMPQLANPVDNVFICNEAYSDDQGWVNGSLRSADLALAHLGIEPLPVPVAPPAGQKPIQLRRVG